MRPGPTIRLLVLLLVALVSPGLVACNGDAADDGAAGETAAPAGDAALGQTVFTGTCATCHGPDAMGLPGLGKNLHANAFVAERTDEAMVEFLKVGRPAGDPLNTTGVDMPPKGGNPALTDEDLLNVVAYVRSLK
jgi:disulfide bond formation protein DsbB